MSKLTWTTKKVKLSKLKLLKRNPRKSSAKFEYLLDSSIDDFGFVEIPAVNFDFTIIAGNQRVKTLRKKFGNDYEIDVRYPNRLLTEEELRTYALKSNKVTAGWDMDMLIEDTPEEKLHAVGFSADELKKVLKPKGQLYPELDHKNKKLAHLLEYSSPFIVLSFNDVGIFKKMVKILGIEKVHDPVAKANRKTCLADGHAVFDMLNENKKN